MGRFTTPLSFDEIKNQQLLEDLVILRYFCPRPPTPQPKYIENSKYLEYEVLPYS